MNLPVIKQVLSPVGHYINLPTNETRDFDIPPVCRYCTRPAVSVLKLYRLRQAVLVCQACE